jgi:predicted O-methyltransferase YrrM
MLDGTCGETEVPMTFKIADIANEAQLVELADKLSDALSADEPPGRALDLDPNYVEAAKTLLATLSERVSPLPSGTVALTEQQVESFLDFDPVFLDVAKDMLREFIERTEKIRKV